MVTPLSLSPLVSPGPGPVDLLNDVRAPFHFHPHHSVAMLVVRSYPNPKRAFSSGQRSVGEPAPRIIGITVSVWKQHIFEKYLIQNM